MYHEMSHLIFLEDLRLRRNASMVNIILATLSYF